MFLERLKIWAKNAVSGAALFGSAISQAGWPPLLLHDQSMVDTLPIASYRNIKVDDFRRLVIGAFKASQFSFIDVAKTDKGTLQYRFAYPVASKEKAGSVVLILRVDENVDKNKRCANCFLRLAKLTNLREFEDLPRMMQYELSSQIFPGIDRAFDKIRVDGQPYMDANFGFTYKNQWKGERNVYGNSFVGLELAELKSLINDAYRDAGFVFKEDEQNNSSFETSKLSFIFSLDSNKAVGAIYEVGLLNQFDSSGLCNPCEMKEFFDPHQALPTSGLSGMASRLTLESRFTAARTLAYEKLKNATERYLRPRSVFTVPPKSAPLGSPRPPLMPMVVT